MRKQRVVVLVHESLVPPESMEGYSDKEVAVWKTEFDVISTLKDMGHEVTVLGVSDELRRLLAIAYVHIRDDHLGALSGEGQRSGPADACAPTRHERALAF